MPWPDGVERLCFEKIDSTSAEARRRSSDLTTPTWIFATEQTAAKGRRGRPWVFAKGNFAASFVFQPMGGVQTWGVRSFIASLALFDALHALTGLTTPFALKWPNDLLLNGGKLAGILLETALNNTLIIGIGVNLGAAPLPTAVEPGAIRPVSLLEETGQKIAAENLLCHLAEAYAIREAQFETHGFAPIRKAWLAHASHLGDVIQVRTLHQTFAGRFETIDTDGYLMLRTSDGLKRITAGDVFFDT